MYIMLILQKDNRTVYVTGWGGGVEDAPQPFLNRGLHSHPGGIPPDVYTYQ